MRGKNEKRGKMERWGEKPNEDEAKNTKIQHASSAKEFISEGGQR